jgi:hypothetical protein
LISNLAALADYISTLPGAGVNLLPDDALEDYLRRVAGLPRRTAPWPSTTARHGTASRRKLPDGAPQVETSVSE